MEGSAITGSEQKPDSLIINVNQTAEVQSGANSTSKNKTENEEVKVEVITSIASQRHHTNLAKDIVEMLKNVKPLPSPEERPECCIYRVPDMLRNLNPKAYTPQVISIGPYHHGSKRLEAMEKHKVRLFKRFWGQHGEKLEELLNIIRKNEEKICSFYAEKVELSSDDFVKMVLVDAIFIIEFICTCAGEDYKQSVSDSYIYWDLMLLENQLPFFIIKDLYNHIFSLKEDFTSLVFEFFQSIIKQGTTSKFPKSNNKQVMPLNPSFELKHFVDLLRDFLLPKLLNTTQLQESGVELKVSTGQHLPSASQLHESGVKFKASTGDSLDFTNGVLEIPCLKIEDHTQSLFRNIMAFEQCHYPSEAGFVDYIALLDSLINTTADVDLLVRQGILFHKLGDSKAVIALVNNLCTNIVRSEIKDTHSSLREDLCKFYKKRRHLWKAILKHDYFSTPWRVASTVAAVILLTLTVIQTACSILQVV